MEFRLALYELAARHQLDRRATARLLELAVLQGRPLALVRRLPMGIAILAAALCGLGIIFWIAANWPALGRFGRFGLLEVCLATSCVGALGRHSVRVPLGLFALLATGGVFAYFGQTYQTGADPWQLFALWALLSTPLCLALRSDVLWAPWSLVAITAVSLWVHAHTGHSWRAGPDDLAAYLWAWVAVLLLLLALSSPLHRYTGAGTWALRTALTLAVAMISLAGLANLFGSTHEATYGVALILMIAISGVFAGPRAFDVYGLSAGALGLNTLLVAGLARLLFEGNRHNEPIFELLVLGLSAAAMLAATVMCVLALARRNGPPADPA